MAKFVSPYPLCPLIERRNFLGVSDDSVAGFVIVTLAKNIVIRYKLSDQKQVNSWSSKDKLIAPVVYDPSCKQYVGAFNGVEVARWDDSIAQLNKLKKLKFKWLIHSILHTKNTECILVYKNGIVSPLSVEEENRKLPDTYSDSDFLPLSEEVEDAKVISVSGNTYVSLSTVSAKERFVHLKPVNSGIGQPITVKLSRGSDVYLIGHTTIDTIACKIITLWSDGKLYSFSVCPATEVSFPGSLVGSVAAISPLHPASIIPVSETHVAIYGADPNSEGAALALFNLKFGIVETCLRMKVYNQSPKMWKSRTNEIILLSGGYLVVVPFKLGTPSLASLVGSHTSSSPLQHPKWIDDMDTLEVNPTEDIPHEEKSTLAHKIREFKALGLSEAKICDLIFPDLIEKSNVDGIKEVVSLLTDIPDLWLIETLVLCSKCKSPFLETLLTMPLVGDEKSLLLLRSRLDLPTVLTLLDYVSRLFQENTAHRNAFHWTCLFLDSHYQQYLLSKDVAVKEALTKVEATVKQHIEYLTVMTQLEAQLAFVLRGAKRGTLRIPTTDKSYTIENIRLF